MQSLHHCRRRHVGPFQWRGVHALFALLCVLAVCHAPRALAADPFVFESASAGSSAGHGGVAANNVFASGYTFRFTEPVTLSEVGAQLTGYSQTSATVYAALYRVGTPISTPDVVTDTGLIAHTLLTVPNGTDQDIHAPLVTTTLEPGWYAIVLGSGQFGATASSIDVVLGNTNAVTEAPESMGPYSVSNADNSQVDQSGTWRIYLRGQVVTPVPPPPDAFVVRSAKPWAAWNNTYYDIDATTWSATRFEVGRSVRVDRVSAWFLGGGSGAIFAAIVQLPGSSAALPEPGSQAFANALMATTLISPGARAEEYAGSFGNLRLQPGSYAMVFGSGQYGASGSANPLGIEDVDVLIQSQRWTGSQWNPAHDKQHWVLEGLALPLQASPNPVAFGNVGVGLNVTRSLTVTNESSSAVTLGVVTLSGSDAAQFALDTNVSQCSGASLAPQANCSFGVRYQPAATGSHAAAVEVAFNGTDSPLVVPLTGTGVTLNTVTPSAGAHGSIAPATPQLVYDGAQPVFQLTPDTHYHLLSVGGSCGGSLAGTTYTTNPVFGDCNVTATFAINQHQVGGSVIGLADANVVTLQLSGGETLVTGNGSFQFTTPRDYGSGYQVSVLTQPGTPAQTCLVLNASGTLPDQNVTGVVVSCTTNHYAVGGSLTGLTAGDQLTLQLNGANDMTLTAADSTWVFPVQMPSGAGYAVSLQAQPPGRQCSLANASGTIAAADISNIAVSCVAAAPDLHLSVDDGQAYLRYGQVRDYLVTLSNSGNADASGVPLRGHFSAAFDVAYMHWQCLSSGSGACAPQGQGGFAVVADVPAQGSVTWIVSMPVFAASPEASATFTVGPAVPSRRGADGSAVRALVDVSDMDTLVLFRDGVEEAYGDGSRPLAGSERAVLTGDGASLVLTIPASAPPGLATLRRIRVDGAELAIQQLVWQGRRYVRLLGHTGRGAERATRWVPVRAGAPLVIGSTRGRHARPLVLLEGSRESLRWPPAEP